MASTLKFLRSEASANRWPDEPPVAAMYHPADVDNRGRVASSRPSLGKRASRALARFLIVFCIGVGATLSWQSYGDVAREIIASLSPQLAWVVPKEPLVQAAPAAIATYAPAAVAPASPSPDVQQLETMSLGLAALRQRVDQLAAQLAFNQQQTMGEVAKLQSAGDDILRRMSAPSAQPAAAVARKPVPARAQFSGEALPLR